MSLQLARAGPLSFKALHSTAIQLEAQLTECTSDSIKRHLVDRLRDAYVACIFADLNQAQRHQIDQSLWKMCFYRPIEAQRRAVRAFATAADRRGLQFALPPLMATIDQALHFYNDLIKRLAAVATTTSAISMHRCHIFLGDLERYAQLHNGNRLKSWGRASSQYFRALELVQGSGHPHNQLAVVAGYRGAHTEAIYHYCLALGAELPFVQARVNVYQHLSRCSPRCGPEQHEMWESQLLQLLRGGDAQVEQQLVGVLTEHVSEGRAEELYKTVVIVACLAWAPTPLMPQLQRVASQLLLATAQMVCAQQQLPTQCVAALEFGAELLVRSGAVEQRHSLGCSLKQIIDEAGWTGSDSGGSPCDDVPMRQVYQLKLLHAESQNKPKSQSAPETHSQVAAGVQTVLDQQLPGTKHGWVASSPSNISKRQKISSLESGYVDSHNLPIEHYSEGAALGGKHLANVRILVPSWAAAEDGPNSCEVDSLRARVEHLEWQDNIKEVIAVRELSHIYSGNPFCT